MIFKTAGNLLFLKFSTVRRDKECVHLLYGVDISINAGIFLKIIQVTLCISLLSITWSRAKNIPLLKSFKLVKFMPNKWLTCTLDKVGTFFGITSINWKENTQLKTIIFKWLHIRLEFLPDFLQDWSAPIWIWTREKLLYWRDLLKLWELLSKFKMIFLILKENNSSKLKVIMEKTFMKEKLHWWFYIILLMDNKKRKIDWLKFWERELPIKLKSQKQFGFSKKEEV